MSARQDPLEGKREGINAGEIKQLTFKQEKDEPCPVAVGDTFQLRNCFIEVTEITRRKRGKGKEGEWYFVAQFTRYRKASRPYLLARRGYTHDPRQAIKADLQDHDLQEPEPEAVPPHEVAELDGSMDAYHRHLMVVAEARAAHEALPIEQRIASVKRAAEERHIDVSKHEQVIKQRVSAMEREVFDKEAA